MSSQPLLNHPYTIYPREPTSAYTKYRLYNVELYRLYNSIIELSTKIEDMEEHKNQLTVLILGTPMESALHKGDCNKTYIFQWEQLFPNFIFEFVEFYKKHITVNIIIISPDDIFMDDTYNEPLFTEHCEDFDFIKIKNREYIHRNEIDDIEIKIDIFTCPFPQLETRSDVIYNCNRFIKENPFLEIEDYTPTETDVIFITEFYTQIERIAKNKKSNLIINSYATFRNIDTDVYGLFPTLLKVANEYKIIATEWSFKEKNYEMRIVSRIPYTVNHIKYLISYVHPCYLSSLSISDFTEFEPIDFKKKEVEPKNISILIKFPYYKMSYIQYEFYKIF